MWGKCQPAYKPEDALDICFVSVSSDGSTRSQAPIAVLVPQGGPRTYCTGDQPFICPRLLRTWIIQNDGCTILAINHWVDSLACLHVCVACGMMLNLAQCSQEGRKPVDTLQGEITLRARLSAGGASSEGRSINWEMYELQRGAPSTVYRAASESLGTLRAGTRQSSHRPWRQTYMAAICDLRPKPA